MNVSFLARRELRWYSFGVAITLGLLVAAPALACTPPPGGVPHYTIAQHVAVADVVLEGTISRVTGPDFQGYTATVQVQQYFKGSGPATVVITNFGTGADCRASVHAGQSWIFFASGAPNTGLAARYLGPGDAIAEPDAETIAQILAAINSKARAYMPIVRGAGLLLAADAPTPGGEGTIMGSALLLMVAGALGLSRWSGLLRRRE